MMEWLGLESLDVSLWGIIQTILLMYLIFILYDWIDMLIWKYRYKINVPFPLPLVGTFPHVILRLTRGDPIQQEIKMVEERGPVVGDIVGCMKILQVYDVDLLKKIMVKEASKFQNRFSMENADRPPADKTLLNLKDAQWKRVRSIITPSFSGAKLKMMTGQIGCCAELLVKGLVDKAAAKEVVEPHKHFGCFSMDAIASVAFGINTDSYNTPNDPFVEHAKKAFSADIFNPLLMLYIFFNRTMVFMTNVFGIRGFFPNSSLHFFTSVVQKIIREREEDGNPARVDLLQMMLNAEETNPDNKSHKKLTEEELIAQAFLIFLAGYETTASLLTYMSYALALHPDIQEKLIAEVDEHFTGDVKEIKYDDVMEMPYLDQVVCETLRMYPPLARMNRCTSAYQDVELDGYMFPGGTAIGYCIYLIHHDEKYYPEHDKFIPERFTAEGKAKRDPFTFIPFGNGPRNCIGMRLALLEAKVAIVSVLRKVKFVKVEDTKEPLELNTQEAFLRTKEPIKLGVELR